MGSEAPKELCAWPQRPAAPLHAVQQPRVVRHHPQDVHAGHEPAGGAMARRGGAVARCGCRSSMGGRSPMTRRKGWGQAPTHSTAHVAGEVRRLAGMRVGCDRRGKQYWCLPRRRLTCTSGRRGVVTTRHSGLRRAGTWEAGASAGAVAAQGGPVVGTGAREGVPSLPPLPQRQPLVVHDCEKQVRVSTQRRACAAIRLGPQPIRAGVPAAPEGARTLIQGRRAEQGYSQKVSGCVHFTFAL